MDGQTDGWTDEQMGGRTDGWTDGDQKSPSNFLIFKYVKDNLYM